MPRLNGVKGIGEAAIFTPQDQHYILLFQFAFAEVITQTRIEFNGANSLGDLRRRDASTGPRTIDLNITFQAADPWQIGFSRNSVPQQQGTVTIWVPQADQVPAVAPYEITDASTYITGNVAEVGFYIERDELGNPGGSRKVVTTNPPAVGEVEVDTTNTKAVFNAADAGRIVYRRVPRSIATGVKIGEMANPFPTFSMFGVPYGGKDEVIEYPRSTGGDRRCSKHVCCCSCSKSTCRLGRRISLVV